MMGKLRDEVDSVLARISAGTQLGQDGRLLPPLSIPKDAALLSQISSASALVLMVLGDALTSDARPAVVWKVAAYATRRRPENKEFRSDLARSIQYLLFHPHVVTSRCGLGGIIKMAREAQLAEQRRLEKSVREIDGTPVPWVPPVVVWETDNGAFRLCELKHPRHIRNVGRALGNCLHSNFVPGFECLELDYRTEAALPYLSYWRSMVTGENRLFAIYAGDRPRAALQVKGNALIAFDLPVDNILPTDIQRTALAELAATLKDKVLRVQTRLPDMLPIALSDNPNIKIEIRKYLSKAPT